LWDPDRPCPNLDKFRVLVGSACQHDLVNHTVFVCLQAT
jgi:hypothetical protein